VSKTMNKSYQQFCSSKFSRIQPSGIANLPELPAHLFPFQRDLVRVALQRGRCALFADTGLGKTHQELAWARAVAEHTQRPTLILTPLAVAAQTIALGARHNIAATRIGDAAEVQPGINVCNYDRAHRLDPSVFGGVVLDEASVLKDYASATRNQMNEMFCATPFRLAATATPAPNDWTELGNQAQFLGIRTREEMLAEFFVHDGGSTQDWRLKGHAERAFWEWVASWALVVRRPSDLGYEDGGFALPELRLHERIVSLGNEYAHRSGSLFVESAHTLSEQRAVRRNSIAERVAIAAELVAAEPDESWLIWGELNDECDEAQKEIAGASQVAGKDDEVEKEDRLLAFAEGRLKRLVSKPGICGHGLNFQSCARQIFLGASHSYERVYQAIRRSWRYGQKRPVDVYFIATDADRAVLENLRRKERDAQALAAQSSVHMIDLTRGIVRATSNERADYVARVPMRVPSWLRSEAA